MVDEIRDDAAFEDEAPLEVSGEEPVPGPGDTAKLAAIEESLEAPAEEAGDEPGSEADAEPVPEEAMAAESEGEEAATEAVATEAVPGVDLGPEGRSNLWVWVGLAAGVLIAVAAVGYAWWYSTSRPIVVPDVTGKLPAQATQALNDAGLRLGKVSEMPTDTAPAGTVISQSPEALDELKPDATVNLVLAAPPENSKVPDVSGRRLAEAAETLAASRLNATPVESFSTTAAAGYVISQLPTVGTEIAPGGSVALVVSKGPAPTSVRVPQLSGLPTEDALSLLAQLDVRALQYRSVDGSIPAGIVVTQTPLPGTQVTPGSAIQYLVSEGLAVGSVLVPEVTAQTRKDAEKELKDRGLKVEARSVFSSTVKKGVVISQMPFPKMKVAQGATVGIVISNGPAADVKVPAIVGKRSAEASKAASAADLRPIFVTVPMPGAAQDTVFAQFPAPASLWPARFPLIALVVEGQ